MPENHFDGLVAATYDEFEADMFASAAVDPVVDFLVDLLATTEPGLESGPTTGAGPESGAGRGAGRALELGVGTGRIALPLSARGVEVHGIELSPAMADQISTKPGGDHIGVIVGDFATAQVDGTFGLAYLVFNTIMNLTTQDEQTACFANVARHLEPGGHFVIEVMVPELQQLEPGQTLRRYESRPGAGDGGDGDGGGAAYDVDEYDIAAQGLISHHYRTVDGTLVEYSMPFRYVWPAELDLMARLAGMTLRERWASWNRHPFTSDCASHVLGLDQGRVSGPTFGLRRPDLSSKAELRVGRSLLGPRNRASPGPRATGAAATAAGTGPASSAGTRSRR